MGKKYSMLCFSRATCEPPWCALKMNFIKGCVRRINFTKLHIHKTQNHQSAFIDGTKAK